MYDILSTINNEDKTVAYQVEKNLESIEQLACTMCDTLNNGGRIFYVGAGTSGRLGVLDSAECPPTFGIDRGIIISLIAGGNGAMLEAVENAEDSETLSIKELKNYDLTTKDMVVGIAASGRTPYAISAVKYATELGCNTGSISASSGAELSSLVNFPVEIEVGPEVITGSTRMKAGTAQKLVLNMLSTAVMIKRGRVYNNEMVSLIASNKKLEQRSINILKRIVNISEEEANELIISCDKDLKCAILVKLLNICKEEANELLLNNNESVKSAMKAYNA